MLVLDLVQDRSDIIMLILDKGGRYRSQISCSVIVMCILILS